MTTKIIYLSSIFFFFFACQAPVSQQESLQESPNATSELSALELFKSELFKDVANAEIFEDGKTWSDCTPLRSLGAIVADYEASKNNPNFDLKAFVNENFGLPKQYASGFKADTSRTVQEHIEVLWDILKREPEQNTRETLLPLPNSFIVPGGRFGEVYYWDSYFTMLGLKVSGRSDMIENMIDNFAYLMDTIGHIPNSNRFYHFSRSQPPFFSLMVELLASAKGEEIYTKYLPHLEKEYNFWMAGKQNVTTNKTGEKRVVQLADGVYLNRYWDNNNTPRPEMYHQDISDAEESQNPEKLYREIRAACESGWDFSSRWFRDAENLATIHTTEIIPVDQNALLYNLEKVLAKTYQIQGNTAKSEEFEKLANQRKENIYKYCWDAETGYFRDYDFVAETFTPVISVAGAFPAFIGLMNPEDAPKMAKAIREKLLRLGGLPATNLNTGQQWDAPNGWAPLIFVAYKGMKDYGETELANDIKTRWVALNQRVYKNNGKLIEKYNVEEVELLGGGGEYPVQDGFGWTNGVLLALLNDE